MGPLGQLLDADKSLIFALLRWGWYMDLIVARLGYLGRSSRQIALFIGHEAAAFFKLRSLKIDHFLVRVALLRISLQHLIGNWVALKLERRVITCEFALAAHFVL